MSSAWLTYAWEDNKSRDVDYAAQELVLAGLDIKLDRWNLGAGLPLWDQIARFIQDPALSDGWILYATQTSLGNEKCREELAYALDRALKTRGAAFPVIALFPSTTSDDLIPAAIRIRLYVSLSDPDWKSRVVAAVRGESPGILRPKIDPFEVVVHPAGLVHGPMIEVRPRAGTWGHFLAGVPLAEKEIVGPELRFGPRGSPSRLNITMVNLRTGPSGDQRWWVMSGGYEATPTQSYYVVCQQLPSSVLFGNADGPHYITTFAAVTI